MDSPRWFNETNQLLNEFIFYRNLLKYTITLTCEMRNTDPLNRQNHEQTINELQRQLTIVERNFRRDIQRIQENMRQTF